MWEKKKYIFVWTCIALLSSEEGKKFQIVKFAICKYLNQIALIFIFCDEFYYFLIVSKLMHGIRLFPSFYKKVLVAECMR